VFRLDFKPRAAGARSFTEAEITAKAEEIVSGMRAAKAAGKAVMFYSAIIGSIPGQTQTAIALVTAFVASLREKMAGTYIINPAEHFEEGMDADDLMFMWEKVQRSGLLDVWRFQTHFDIERASPCSGSPCRRPGPARTPPSPRAAPRKCISPCPCRPASRNSKSSAPIRRNSFAAANTASAASSIPLSRTVKGSLRRPGGVALPDPS